MMDDSLDDVQQEKKMAEELKFEGPNWCMYVQEDIDHKILITIEDKQMWLDRSQAHLLMLYLQEHLRYVGIDKDLAQKDDAFDQ